MRESFGVGTECAEYVHVEIHNFQETSVAKLMSNLKKVWFIAFPLEAEGYRFERGLVIRAHKPRKP